MNKLLASFLAVFAIVSSASAQLIDSRSFSLTGTHVSLNGTIEFNKLSSTTGSVNLHIDLSDLAQGVLTGVGLNVDSRLHPYSLSETSSDSFTFFGFAPNVSLGGENFDSSAWALGCQPSGVNHGNTVDFSFKYFASTAAKFNSGFTMSSFFGDADAKDAFFYFEGIPDGGYCGLGSDEVLYWGWSPANPRPEALTNGAVPEPSTYGLIGAAALCGLVLVRRRNRK